LNILVAGIGYVGLANAVLLAQRNRVVAYDINAGVIDKLNRRQSHIMDAEISRYLAEAELDITGTSDKDAAFGCGADFIIISTPTNYDPERNYFDTSSIENVLEEIRARGLNAAVVIKSTIPIGYTEKIKERFGLDIIFSPEFLREGKALYDNLYPSRIVMGSASEKAHVFAGLLTEAAIKKDIPVLFMNSTEAESIKLFSNTYLALRVAYFNELDTFAEMNGLDAESIIKGICLDPRVGDYYNNPSFGYGGYCLPKDTKQLLENYRGIPNDIISAVVKANRTRKEYIAGAIMSGGPSVVGVYRLVMKSDSDNLRESSIQDIIIDLISRGVRVIVYEPIVKTDGFLGAEVTRDLEAFKKQSDIIVANRWYEELGDVKYKVYTRDIFGNN